jgi:ABC-type branched-subunit amino acid transport system substrate-binding protein
MDWAWTTTPIADYADAIVLALEEAYEARLIDRKVELIARKVHGGPTAAALDVRAAFRELVDAERVLAVIGPTLPDDLMACRHDIERAMVPVLSFGGTLALSCAFLFQLPNGTYGDEIRMIVNYARHRGVRSVALLHDRSMMGDEYAWTFRTAMRECGLRIAGIREISSSPSMESLEEASAVLRDTAAEALLVISVAVHSNFVTAMTRVGWNPMKLMVCNFVGSTAGFDGPSAFEGWIGIDQFDESNPVFQRMTDRFAKRFGRQVAHTYQAIGYDLGRTLARGLSMMSPSTPEGLRDALERVRMLPAAAGGKGTVISFAGNDRRGYKGDYLVYRTVVNGVNTPLGGLSDFIEP